MKKLFAEFVQNNSNGNYEICLQIFQAQSLLMQKVIIIGEVNTQRVAKIGATFILGELVKMMMRPVSLVLNYILTRDLGAAGLPLISPVCGSHFQIGRIRLQLFVGIIFYQSTLTNILKHIMDRHFQVDLMVDIIETEQKQGEK